jgi:hypothetical protein
VRELIGADAPLEALTGWCGRRGQEYIRLDSCSCEPWTGKLRRRFKAVRRVRPAGRSQVIAEYVRTYHDERKRLAAEADARRIRLERRLGELNREIDRLVDAIAKGLGEAALLGSRSTALNEERKRVATELSSEPPPGLGIIIPLHTKLYQYVTSSMLQPCRIPASQAPWE